VQRTDFGNEDIIVNQLTLILKTGI